jgi:hypothetical protein
MFVSNSKRVIQLSLLTLCIAGAVTLGLRFSHTSPLSLTAQVGTTLLFNDAEPFKPRATALVNMLNDFQNRISKLTERKPTITGVSRLIGTGPDSGYTKASFGIVALGSVSHDVVVEVKNQLPNPATFHRLSGLIPPFSLVGGTCGDTIPLGGCTLVFQYAPRADTPGTNFGGVIGHSNVIQLEALPHPDDLEEQSNKFTLYGYVPAADTETIVDDLVAELRDMPAPVLPGEISLFHAAVTSKTKNETRPVFFKDVVISGLSAPFGVTKNDCAATAVVASGCDIELRFSPTAKGTYQGAFTVSFDVGLPARKTFQLTVNATALSTPANIDPATQVLIVYNESWPESVQAKDYYIANRPGFDTANAVGVRFPVSPTCSLLPCLAEAIEVAPFQRIRNEILDPVVAWMRAHPNKDIQYMVLMPGLPNRPQNSDFPNIGAQPDREYSSVQRYLRRELSEAVSKEVFVTTLEMGSLEATKRYIDKLKATYGLMSAKSPLLSARGTSVGGTTYYFSDAYTSDPTKHFSSQFLRAIKSTNPSANVVTREDALPVLNSAADVTGIFLHGIYGYNRNRHYATDDTLRFSGRSGWYLIEVAESFNGQWLAGSRRSDFPSFKGPWHANAEQSSFTSWFASGAFGGANYSNTPVAAMTHVLEPGSNGAATPSLFACWESGKPFAYCAWKYNESPARLQAVGDPLVTR